MTLRNSAALLTHVFVWAGLILAATPVAADGPADNDPNRVRRVPKLGIELPAADRERLQSEVDRLRKRVEAYAKRKNASHQSLLPDVQIFVRAVGDAIKYQEFFDLRDIKAADEILRVGETRMTQLEQGKAAWMDAKGLVVRGFVSRLDGTVQPYGLVIPDAYSHQGPRFRLDVWFHGRGETMGELRFLHQRMRSAGVFAPKEAIVLHPYGRYSNAFKFAGEVDTLESIDSTRGRYRIDDERTSVRGFSMGGAGCWQFAVHYSDRWFAANPGAGFSETPEFLRFFQKETLRPKWWEQKLWRWYDCTDWSINLNQCPTIAYSGELDIQKQAADIMAKSLEKQGIRLTHIIGPQTAHRYHPQARDEVERRIGDIAIRGRNRMPRRVRFNTYTLKYNRMNWVRVDALGEHWERANVDATIVDGSTVRVAARNVTDLTFEMPSGWCPLQITAPVRLVINDQTITAPGPFSDRSWSASVHLVDGRWRLGRRQVMDLRKVHGLQGPIDDALMDSFLFVEPSGKARHEAVHNWTLSELRRAKEHWRRHFRGEAPAKKDSEITDDDIANANLILWGDPASNQVLAKIADALPVSWTDKQVRAGTEVFPANQHALIMIYPNPLNPKRYVVLNSSFTFREYAYLNNARQTAKLPDWAIIDLREKPGTRWPGRVAAANFFDEYWGLRPPVPAE